MASTSPATPQPRAASAEATSSQEATGQRPEPGSRVRVVQQMPQATQVWTQPVEGVVVRYLQAPTGSWYARSRDDRLWLDRLELRLDDGELTVLNLDRYSVIEVLPGAIA